eukprot:349990-Chlamydomonas_euryale.AAC.12
MPSTPHLKGLEANQSTARSRAEKSSASSKKLLHKPPPRRPILRHPVLHAIPQDTQHAQHAPHTIRPATHRAAGQERNIM